LRTTILRVTLAAGALAAVLAAAAPAATVTDLVQVTGAASPFTAADCADQPAQTGSTVYPGAEVEPQVAVDPTDPADIAGSYQQDRYGDGAARGLGSATSTNGGAGWSTNVIPGITWCSGGDFSNGGDFSRATDPWLTYAADGKLFHISQQNDIIEKPANAPGGEGKSGMAVSTSTDDGANWSAPKIIHRDEDPKFLNDKVSITADRFSAAHVYATWDRLRFPNGVVRGNREFIVGYHGPVLFSRTTDGGATWEPARIIYDPGGTNQVLGVQIVQPAPGTLVNVFTEFLRFRNDDLDRQFDVNLASLRSTDNGASWGRVSHGIDLHQPAAVRTPEGTEIRSAGNIVDIAVNPTHGDIYAVWEEVNSQGSADVAFSRSANGGLTWSAPARIDDGGDAFSAFLPTVHVRADGRIGVTYYDFRNDAMSPEGVSNASYRFTSCASSCTSASSWAASDEVAGGFNFENAPVARGLFVGDYEGLGAAGSAFKAFFGAPGASEATSDIWAATITP